MSRGFILVYCYLSLYVKVHRNASPHLAIFTKFMPLIISSLICKVFWLFLLYVNYLSILSN